MIDQVATLAPVEVYPAEETSPAGLSAAEAQARLERYGPNVLREERKTPLVFKLLANFTHLMALLLWAAAGMSLLAGQPQLAIAIVAVIIINAAFSFWQEFKAEKAVEALKALLPSYARVMRDSQEQRVLAADLVPGDLLVLAEGDAVSADARVVEEFELRTNNSTLTGESVPVRRFADASPRPEAELIEQPNIVFTGTSVSTGTGRAIVFATGMQTVFGGIANLTQTVQAGQSPMQREIGLVTRVVTAAAITAGVVFFLLATFVTHTSFSDAFVFGIGMIVAFVPEGLLPLVTLSLAVGVQRMVRRHALIKKLSAVETLGSTTVICTDKTGTLTQNEMTVRDIWLPSGPVAVSGAGYEPRGEFTRAGEPITAGAAPDLAELLRAAALCSNARLLTPQQGEGRWSILGDPTEGALLVAAEKSGIDLQELADREPRLRELPFESVRKRMATINQVRGQFTAYVKGAPTEVLRVSTHVQVGERVEPLDEGMRQQILSQNDQYARQALRVLAVARRPLPDAGSSSVEDVERDLVFLGLEAMYDPPRVEVGDAVARARRAGIRIIMITGDYGLTALAIAQRVGIVQNEQARVVTGEELEGMDEGDLERALGGGDIIFARVAPEHKLRVVSALKDLGQIVAVTGDGVNDAPALKRADIGIAMGITGTDVAKEAADMILTDDNFASIVSAIEEGRGVYADVRKFVGYVFVSNFAEAVPFIFFVMSGGAIPLGLTVLQVLAVDLAADLLPALGLGLEAADPGVMLRPPRSQKEHLIDGRLLRRVWLWLGPLEALFAMAAFFYTYWINGFCCRLAPLPGFAQVGRLYLLATTMTLTGIIAGQIGNVYAIRTDRVSTFRVGLFSNRILNIGVLAQIVVILAIDYLPPLQHFFGTAAPDLRLLAFVVPIPIVFFLLEEARKWVVRRTQPAE